MATKTEMDLRVEIDLESLRLMILDLPEVADEWSEMGGGERASWSHDWDQLMGALKVTLDPQYRSGAMSPDQGRSYRDLLRRLEEALPIIDRLQLYPPPVALTV